MAAGRAAFVLVVLVAEGVVEERAAFHVLDVKEPGLLQADIDESGLQSGKDRVDHSLIDVAYETGRIRPLVKNFAETAIFEDGDALFVGPYVDKNFPLGAGNTAMGMSHSVVSLK